MDQNIFLSTRGIKHKSDAHGFESKAQLFWKGKAMTREENFGDDKKFNFEGV